MPTCIIDIDITLADNDHRTHLLKENVEGNIPQEAWDAFMSADLVVLDKPQAHALEVLNYMRGHGYRLVFLTGRNEKLRAVTELWLKSHAGWNPETETLIMRDRVSTASEFKEAAFLQYRNSNPDDVFLFFEDDPFVLTMWQKYGLVFKCPEAWATMNPSAPHEPEPLWRK